jgi:hypothetical protein
LGARALGGPAIELKHGRDARAELFAWMRRPDNPYFARSFVNRVWGHYFGVGLVQPVDDFSQANPPSNPRLLDALAAEFAARGFDIRHVERTILNSRTYQLAALPNDSNRLDRDNFSHGFVRPLMAEVVVDALNSALGTAENFGPDAPPNCHAIEIGASRVQNPTVNQVFRIFGRPPRSMACDCDRTMQPALSQTLFRMTDPGLLAKLSAPTGRVRQLLARDPGDDELLDELFLAALSRFPTPAEQQQAARYRTGKAHNREQFAADVLWALLNTREFILNH